MLSPEDDPNNFPPALTPDPHVGSRQANESGLNKSYPTDALIDSSIREHSVRLEIDTKGPNVTKDDGSDRAERASNVWAIGKEGFNLTRDLTENGRRLFLLIFHEAGWKEGLAEFAEAEGIDLNTGLKELREHDLIDENEPKIITILKKG